MTRRQRKLDAIRRGLDEAERKLRNEPAHRLRDVREGRHWYFETRKVGTGVWVETGACRALDASAVEITMLAGATGLFKRPQLERHLTLPLTDQAARVPDLLYLIFASDGSAYAFETPKEAEDSLDFLDLDFDDDHYQGSYSDRGEILTKTPGPAGTKLQPSGTFDPIGLAALITNSCTFSELAHDPHSFALAVWYAD